MTGLGKRARQKLERPGEILRAAFEEFIRRGYVASRVEDIAAEVGVTKGTVYLYFETKEALFSAVIRQFAPALHREGFEPAPDRTMREQLSDYLSHLYGAVASEHETRQVFHLLMSEGRHFPELVDQYYSEFLAPALDHLKVLLAAGVERCELRPSEAIRFPELLLGPAVIANIWTMALGARRPLDKDAFLKAHLDMLFDGLARESP